MTSYLIGYSITQLIVILALPIAIGIWIGRRKGGVMQGFAQGALIVFGIVYLNELRSDYWEWNTFWPQTAGVHMFGPNWASDILLRAIGKLKIPFAALALSYGVKRYLDRRKPSSEASKEASEGNC